VRSLRILAAAAAALTATGAALTGPVGAASPASVAARLRAAGLRPVALLPAPLPSLLRHSKATLDEITGDGYSVSYQYRSHPYTRDLPFGFVTVARDHTSLRSILDDRRFSGRRKPRSAIAGHTCYLIPADISFLYACRIQGFTYRFLSKYYGGATKATLRELIRGLRPV